MTRLSELGAMGEGLVELGPKQARVGGTEGWHGWLGNSPRPVPLQSSFMGLARMPTR